MALKNRITEKGFFYHLSVLALILVPHSIYSFYLVKKGTGLYLFNIAARDGLIILIIYINLYLLIPFFHKVGRYISYFTLIGILVGLFIFVSWELEAYIARLMKYTDESFFFTFISSFFNIAQYLLISFFLFNLKEKFDQEKKLDAIALEKLKTEINYLRAQINPHFLFNTLNNLYALA
jgi:two-component system LytT family sensor kinase